MTDIVKEFRNWFEAEQVASEAKRELDSHTARLKVAIAQSENRADAAKDAIAKAMAESGEYEITLPGTACVYKIGWSTPRESVKVVDLEAVPEEFVKVERKPKLKEIGEYLKTLGTPPNWARFEKGERKLEWRAVKKS